MHYKIFGSKIVDIVIEMGLGACIAEWETLARELGEDHGVLVYERAGINHSGKSDKERTPTNIAYIGGITLTEYIRKRRMSVSDDCGKGNCDLQNEINHVFQEGLCQSI